MLTECHALASSTAARLFCTVLLIISGASVGMLTRTLPPHAQAQHIWKGPRPIWPSVNCRLQCTYSHIYAVARSARPRDGRGHDLKKDAGFALLDVYVGARFRHHHFKKVDALWLCCTRVRQAGMCEEYARLDRAIHQMTLITLTPPGSWT